MDRIASEADVAEALAALLAADQRLVPVAALAGPLPLRHMPPGFESLIRIIVDQMISLAAGAAIFARMEQALAPFTPENFLRQDEAAFRAAGLSGPKIRCYRAMAAAILDYSLPLDRLHLLTPEEARARLLAVPGIGPWTADLYLLSCLGAPDVWPAGDVALQHAVGAGLGLAARPDAKAMVRLAEGWRPRRAVAARLFWAYYRRIRGIPSQS